MTELKMVIDSYEKMYNESEQHRTIKKAEKDTIIEFGNILLEYILENRIFENTVWNIRTDIRSDGYSKSKKSMIWFGTTQITAPRSENEYDEIFCFPPFSNKTDYEKVEMVTDILNEKVVISLWTSFYDKRDVPREVSMFIEYYPKDYPAYPREQVRGKNGFKIVLEMMKMFGMKVSQESIEGLIHEKDILVNDYDRILKDIYRINGDDNK